MAKRNLETKWIQEILIFITFFLLVTLNGWRGITKMQGALQATAYFAILYAHAQIQRALLIPIFFEKRKPLFLLVYSFILILIFALILYFADIDWIYHLPGPLKKEFAELYVFHIGTCIMSLIAFMGIYIMLHFQKNEKNEALTKLSKNEVELNILHSQLNPHFLFNTFNNLYAISLNEPDRMPDFILQVTKLMRYHLRSYTLTLAPLEDELSFIEAYISLEEERFGPRCRIDYRHENKGKNEKYSIAPLILITFIENAFKHGTDSIEGGFVNINILIQDSALRLTVINSIPAARNSRVFSSGLGYNNTLQRLKILYGNAYTLKAQPEAGQYVVNLVLPLAKTEDGK